MIRRLLHRRASVAVAVVGLALIPVYWLPQVPLPKLIWGPVVVVPADGCLYRVSKSGRVHDMSSEWWFVTSRERCFATRRDAQEFAEAMQ